MKTSLKFLNTLFAVALAITASMTLPSCGDDDEPTPPQGEKTVTSASFTTSLCVNQSLLDAYDIIATSADGKPLQLAPAKVDVTFETPGGNTTIAMYAINLDAQGRALPLTSAMDVKFTLKDGYQLPEKSDLAVAVIAAGTITYSDGSTLTLSNDKFRRMSLGVMRENIDKYTANLNNLCGHIQSTLDEKGITITRAASQQ